MFNNSKYTRWYFALMKSDTGITETHHIIPRSLGGDNSNSNLISISPRKHFLAHWLLTKMLDGPARVKMVWALHRMTFSKNKYHHRTFSSRQYDIARKIFRQIASSSQKARIFSEETKNKMKESSAKRWARVRRGEEVFKSTLGMKVHSDAFKEKQRNNRLGKCISEETRGRMKSARWMSHALNMPRRVQPELMDEYLSTGWFFGRVAPAR